MEKREGPIKRKPRRVLERLPAIQERIAGHLGGPSVGGKGFSNGSSGRKHMKTCILLDKSGKKGKLRLKGPYQ